MIVTVGTFNLNNLFSRYNFQGEVAAIADQDTSVGSTILYQFTATDTFRLRTFMGRLVKAKNPVDTQRIRDRILAIDVDVLAVQEVENIDILKSFNRNELGGLYSHLSLIEGNDPRLIGVGVLGPVEAGR